MGCPDADAEAYTIPTILGLFDAKVAGMFPHAISASLSDAVHPESVILITTQFVCKLPNKCENIC